MHKNKPVNFAPAKQQKMRKRTRKSPKKAKLGAFWVLEGMGTVVGRCERMEKPGKRAEGLGLGCRRGRFAAERHWRSLTPRHAVLEWMWESAPGSGKRPMSSGSHRKSQRGRCWFGAVSSFWRRIVYRLPLLPSKEKHLRQEDGQADQDHGRIGPGGVQLRHRVKIHAVPTSN